MPVQKVLSAKEFDPSQIVFGEPNRHTSADKTIEFTRTTIAVKHSDGKTGPLLLKTPSLFSFGVSENLDKKSNKITGYQLSSVLKDVDGATEEQQEFLDAVAKLAEQCAEYVLDNSEEMDCTKTKSQLLSPGGLSPVYFPKIETKNSKGRIVKKFDDSKSPSLYMKMPTNKNKEIRCLFYEVDGNGEPVDVDPLTYLGQTCNVKAVLRVESIFANSTTCKIQMKLREAVVEPVTLKPKRFLL